MAVNTSLIQQLRNQTGAGVLDAKQALEAAGNDLQQAVEVLRKRGQKVAEKKQARMATAGVVAAYIHGQGRVGVLVKVNCETDFVARTPQFQELAHQLAMHIAAFDPTYLTPEQVPVEVVEREKSDLEKFFAEVCLVRQAFVMDDKKTVHDVITEKIAELGENIQVTDFKRINL